MEAKLQRRVQRYGWDLAASHYDRSWGASLSALHDAILEAVTFHPGDRVLDVACGTGSLALEMAEKVGADGHVVGIDLSGRMIEMARAGSDEATRPNVEFLRMDGEALDFPDKHFDVAVCALGLMYMPDPHRALAEMSRVTKRGGRVIFAVWGERGRCGWADIFPIVCDEVHSEVCPRFFDVGRIDVFSNACAIAGLEIVVYRRIDVALDWPDDQAACEAAFEGTPVAMAWSRFGDDVRARVRQRFLDSLSAAKVGDGYRVPGEIVVVSAVVR
jgi:SAM-dependent methyltransferase